MSNFFNFKTDITDYILKNNPEFSVFDWKLIEAKYQVRYSDQFTNINNLTLFIAKMRSLFYIECYSWLETMKSINYFKKNIDKFLENEGNSQTITHGSNHSAQKETPLNITQDVYESGSKSDSKNHSNTKYNSNDNTKRLEFAKAVSEYMNVNSVYDKILDKLEILFRQVIMDTQMGVRKNRSCCRKPNCNYSCLGINYPSINDVNILVDEKINELDFVEDITLTINEETTDPNTIHIYGKVNKE